ncbi:MAG: conjugal transfer protein TraG, partial [OCS116 cluster bacterium]|nr:conjugal transfer protein TraG [OCS116 cluster bacterium]
MTPTKFLFGQIILVFLVVFLTTWAATQWAADMLGHQEGLGSAWFFLNNVPIYYPHRLYQWWYAYDAYAPEVFNKAGSLAGAGGIVGVIVAIAGSLWRARQDKNVTTYGSSRWLTPKEIRQAQLFEPKGVFLGKFDDEYLRHNGPEHIMAFAPTRSGKGVGLVIPTLLSWTGSVIVHDIKGENWQLTAGWRSKFSHCLMFNPTDTTSAKFNPLLEVRRGDNEVRDVQNIADILVDPEGSLEKRNHWEKTSHALLVGAILHVLYSSKEKTLAQVSIFLSDPRKTFERTLHEMMNTNHLDTGVHPVIASAARELLNKSDNERSGVLSTAMSFLGLYRDPTVAKVTSSSDWRIADIMNGERPVSLYLVVPPSDISRTKPLIRLILNQIGRRLTEKLETEKDKQYKHRLLMMLDEFPALGRLDFFESALAFMAGYGIKAYLIAQSLNQIDKAYGEYNSILDNCHIRVVFATNDERTAKRVSDSLGTATEMRAQKNYAGHRLAPWLSHVMVSRQETMRQLMTPGEVMQLPDDQEVIILSGQPPIKAQKLRYFEDKNFSGRILPQIDLSAGGHYQDRPHPRFDDWAGRIRKAKFFAENNKTTKTGTSVDEGGLGRHPTIEIESHVIVPETEADILGLLDDDVDISASSPNSDPLKQITPSTIQRAHELTRDGDHDLD